MDWVHASGVCLTKNAVARPKRKTPGCTTARDGNQVAMRKDRWARRLGNHGAAVP